MRTLYIYLRILLYVISESCYTQKKISVTVTFLIRSQLGRYCHWRIHFCTIRRALTPSFEWYHCHTTTATPRDTVDRCNPSPLPLSKKLFKCHSLLKSIATRSILPLPRCNTYHSTRLDLLFRLVPLPPCHCHPPPHCRPYQSTVSTTVKKIQKITVIYKPPQLCQYCHNHVLTGTIRRALISSFQRYHCHLTTATPRPTVDCSNPPSLQL
jgi:hypothetical protein